jgi:catechol 2,3-dioxygenase-like lactoylglutathione lyase family enzyme
MSWRLDHVNFVTRDVEAAAEFYSGVLGMEEELFEAIPEEDREHSLPIGHAEFRSFPEESGRLGVHLNPPEPDFNRRTGFWINPISHGHVAFTVDDIDVVKRRLDERGIPYQDAGEFAVKGRYIVYVYDPDMNLLEINAKIGEDT